ncbi:hypothetical protein [Nocardioides sp. WS12]|uniref:hypothetical protein n=1 Tax=Nocardioides sp. WS12 TaxID=2486272 RepID=UPI0015FD6C64|nr:hypothetical protein [Nocardioides sp. WS12]
MTSLEDALRQTFGAVVDGATDRMLTDVRRGARRRRTTRTTLGAVAASALLVGGIAFGGSLLSDDSSRPSPAPKPTETVTDPAPADALGSALAVEAAGDILYVTVDEVACSCSVLYTRGADEWAELHRFPVPFVDRLSFAPDAENGWAAAAGQVWSTHDAGQTWGRVDLPPEAPEDIGDSYVVDSSDTHVWIVNLGSGSLWRSPVGADDFTRFDVPDTDGIQDIAVFAHSVLGEVVVVDPRPTGEGNTTSVPRMSTDGGDSWRELPRPCSGENRMRASRDSIYVGCQGASEPEATLYQFSSTGGGQFVGYSGGGDLSGFTPLTDHLVLFTLPTDIEQPVPGRHGLMTPTGVVPSDTGLTADASIWDAAQVGDRLYLATTEGLLESTDDGRTWHRI